MKFEEYFTGFHWDKLLGKNVKPIYDKPRPGEIKHSFANIDLIKVELNYEPKIDFEEGLKRIIEIM